MLRINGAKMRRDAATLIRAILCVVPGVHTRFRRDLENALSTAHYAPPESDAPFERLAYAFEGYFGDSGPREPWESHVIRIFFDQTGLEEPKEKK